MSLLLQFSEQITIEIERLKLNGVIEHVDDYTDQFDQFNRYQLYLNIRCSVTTIQSYVMETYAGEFTFPEAREITLCINERDTIQFKRNWTRSEDARYMPLLEHQDGCFNSLLILLLEYRRYKCSSVYNLQHTVQLYRDEARELVPAARYELNAFLKPFWPYDAFGAGPQYLTVEQQQYAKYLHQTMNRQMKEQLEHTITLLLQAQLIESFQHVFEYDQQLPDS